jgi:hypothetical protein
MTIQMSEVEIELFPNPERLPEGYQKSLIGTIRHKAMDKDETITFEIGLYDDTESVVIAEKYGTRFDPYGHGTINQAIAHFEINNPREYRWYYLDFNDKWYAIDMSLNDQNWVYKYETTRITEPPLQKGSL